MQLVLAALAWLLFAAAVHADDRAQLTPTAEEGFGRLIIDFRDRVDLPPYKIAFDNGVLSIAFTSPVQLPLPDVSAVLPAYLSAGRMDPDNKGLRFGLRTAVTIHSMEAGEDLFFAL